jgi:hypothetical protein
VAAPGLRAQSLSRDWRPEDRTVIGDFSRITSIATAIDRVYVSSPNAVLIWNPQFRQWQGPYDPPDPSVLARVFAALVDPLDNSLWLARPDGWIHFQPELRLWDQGSVPEGVQTIAFDGNDPTPGLFLRTGRGWQLLPRGGLTPSPGRAPARPVTPARVEDVLRSNPSLQANASQILVDQRLGVVRFTAAARSFDNLGWYLGTSGVGLLFLQDGSALPDRLPFGLRSPVVGALFGAPDGVWAATSRTVQAEPAITFVDRDFKDFRTLQGPAAFGLPFAAVRRLVGQGTALWAATDRGLARIATGDGRVDFLDPSRGLPDAPVYSVASRQGSITAGTRRGLVRVNDSLRVERLAPRFAETVLAVFPAGDSACCSRCPAARTWSARPPSPRPRFRRRSWPSPRWATPSSRSLVTRCSGAIPAPVRGPSVPISAPCWAGWWRSWRTAPDSGWPETRPSPSPVSARPLCCRSDRVTCPAPPMTSRWTPTTCGWPPTGGWCDSGSTPSAREPAAARTRARVRPGAPHRRRARTARHATG